MAKQVGSTPAAWIAQARVRRAQRLLETTDLSIEQVAAKAGFAVPSHGNRSRSVQP
jgi:transcriptional regulator GlxA family with amidase domain